MRFVDQHASVMSYTAIMLCITLLDVLTGNQLSIWVLYFLPIGLATWNLGFKKGSALAMLAVALLLIKALFWGHPFASLTYAAWAIGSRAIAYGVLVFLVSALRKKEIVRAFIPPGVKKGP